MAFAGFGVELEVGKLLVISKSVDAGVAKCLIIKSRALVVSGMAYVGSEI